MRFITSMLTAAAVFGVILAGTIKAEAADYGKQKVVYHINYVGGESDKKYRGALRNIQNHINAVGAENMEIKVVLHGNGLGLLQSAKSGNEKLKGQVVSLKAQNVKFNVCNNTLKGRKIDYEKDLLEVFPEDIIPSGVAELSRLQQMGYTYIKP
jgi:intracellular sulfur oxidation DsrE/DsrF family protein